MRLKRPATKKEEEKGAGAEEFQQLSKVEAINLMRLGSIWLKDAGYFHQPVDVVGSVQNFRVEGGEMLLDFKVSGTQSEALLKEMSGKPNRMACVHVCDPTCPQVITGGAYLHGKKFKQVALEDQTWFTNLEQAVPRGVEEEDQLAALRRAAELSRREEDPPKEEKKKKRKKSRERKAKEKEEEEDEKPKPSSSLGVGQKKMSLVYGGTGLDPDAEVRGRILRKARKMGKSKKKKKKKKSESEEEEEGSGSSSSSSTTVVTGGGLFESEKKLKGIWLRYPGALSASSIVEARENLLTTAGTLWTVDRDSLPPLMTQYGRVNIMPGMSPPMAQEVLSLCVAVDHLLQGKIAATADILCQRIKSLEAIGRGNHWAVARQLELVRNENNGMTNDEEALAAARRAREENKLRNLTTKAPSFSANDGGYGGGNQGKGKKGKDKQGHGKGRSEDQGKNKGDGRRDDKGWQKKDPKT